MIFKLIPFWIKEFKVQRKTYLNGSLLYLMHKLALFRSASLAGVLVLTYKQDIEWYKKHGSR